MILNPKCPCCGADLETDAECLLRIANMIHSRPGKVVVAEGGLESNDLAKIKIALDLTCKPGLLLRALVEEWDYVRVNREMY